MRFVFFLLLLAGPLCGQAQQYLIRHDLHSKKTQYYRIQDKDTARVRHAGLKANSRLLLQVDNFNPFYWDAKVTAIKTPEPEAAAFDGAFNPISVLAGGFKDMLGGFPLLDLPKSRGGGDPNDPAERFVSTATQYADNYNKLQELNEKYDQLQVARLQLGELKFDFTKPEAEIKAEAKAVVQKVLGTDRLELMNAMDIARKYDGQLTSSLQAVGTLNTQLQQQVTTIDAGEVYEGTTFRDIAQKATASLANVARLRQLRETNAHFFLDEVASVAALYREISNADFHFSYALNAGPGLSDLKLEVYPQAPGARDTVVHYFSLERKNGLRIRNSVGVAFTHFNANNTTYFIDENRTIRSGDKDLFTPLLTTLIHFYPGGERTVRLGGSFGFGLPVQGEKKDINFLLGATAAFGQNEPILVSAGFSGAKVNKLTKGYRVGEVTTETDPGKLTAAGYDIGGFLAITFNLGNLNAGRK
ncbi:MAG TPA: hypothetical protein VGE66_03460 [Chitinophagaceae bacterium]